MKRSILKSDSGAAILIAVLLVATITGILFVTGQQHLERINESLDFQRSQIVALQVLQDFAEVAGRANNTFEQYAGICPAGTTVAPTGVGRRFCWSTLATGNCVRHPGPGVQQLCLNTEITVAINDEFSGDPVATWSNPANPTLKSRVYEWLINGKLAFAIIGSQLNLSEPAYAQANAFLPNIAAPPPPVGTNINNTACVAGGAGTLLCKKCPTSPPTNLTECLNVSICVRNGGCGAANSGLWYSQRIGFLPR